MRKKTILCGCRDEICESKLIVEDGRITFCPDTSDGHRFGFVISRKLKKELGEAIAEAKGYEDMKDEDTKRYNLLKAKIRRKIRSTNKPLLLDDLEKVVKGNRQKDWVDHFDVLPAVQTMLFEGELAVVKGRKKNG